MKLARLLPALLALGMLCTSVSGVLASERRSHHIHIAHDNGGSVVSYAMTMLEAKQSGQKVQITGACNSACTLFLALPRNQLCASPDASFGFHLPSGTSQEGVRGAKRYLLARYPRWVRSWISSRGGLAHELKVMQYSDFKNALPPCAQVASSELY